MATQKKKKTEKSELAEVLKDLLSEAQDAANALLDAWPDDESLDRDYFMKLEGDLDYAQGECEDLIKAEKP